MAGNDRVGAGIAAFVQEFIVYDCSQQFFPSAERNQFVIDVWMPPLHAGTDGQRDPKDQAF